MLPPARRGLLSLAFVAVGCAPTVGTECDMAAATTVVHAQFGSPAYVGQSMMITSCAVNGAHCHAAAPQDRTPAHRRAFVVPVTRRPEWQATPRGWASGDGRPELARPRPPSGHPVSTGSCETIAYFA